MISRIWHGWTTLENADTYENLLKSEIFPSIASKNVTGYRGIKLLRQKKCFQGMMRDHSITK